MIDIDIYLLPHHPIRKLLVLINKPSFLIYFCYNCFDRVKKQIWNKIEGDYVCRYWLVLFSTFIFKKKSRFHLRRQAFRNTFIAEEELNGIGIDEIENLEDLPRFVLVNEECRNLEVVHDCGELTKNINQKKKSDFSQSSQALRSRRGRGGRGGVCPTKVCWQCALFFEEPLNVSFLKIFNLK